MLFFTDNIDYLVFRFSLAQIIFEHHSSFFSQCFLLHYTFAYRLFDLINDILNHFISVFLFCIIFILYSFTIFALLNKEVFT
jgi:hypothetical protein